MKTESVVTLGSSKVNVFVLLLRRLEIDRSVSFLLATRIWQILSYPITLLIIAQRLSPELQGFYYTFASLLALQVFVELGLVLVVVNVSSHEWSQLALDKNGEITGDESALSRLTSFGRLIFKWYAAASAVFIAGVGTFGYLFLSQANVTGADWMRPWVVLVVLSGLLLWTLPFNALLEGCNQVAVVNRFRLNQAMLENFGLWLILLLGGGLWAAVAAVGAKLLLNLYLLLLRYRRFFASFLKQLDGPRVRWKTEVWPMQWRLGAAGMVTYFTSSIFTPIIFHYHGPTVAGQMGMTMQMVNGLQLVAMAWVTSNTPRFGMLVAKKEYATLDHGWTRISVISISVVCLGAGILWCVVYFLNLSQNPLAGRLLAPLSTGMFLLAAVFMQAGQCLVTYMRAHKQEPILVPNIVMGILNGLTVWLLGSRFGPIGIGVGYLVQVILGTIWVATIWRHCRMEWHKG